MQNNTKNFASNKGFFRFKVRILWIYDKFHGLSKNIFPRSPHINENIISS